MMQQKHIFILIGDTRTGKSSFINQHSGKTLAQVGLGNGLSTTRQIGFCQVESTTYVDTIGFNDTNNVIKNKVIREQIVDQLCAYGNHDSKIVFIILESFLSDTVRLNDTLKNLEKLFGPTAIESTLLVLTMHNLFNDPEEISATREAIENTCKKLKLKFLDWQSNYEGYKVPDTIHAAQMIRLNTLLSEVNPASLEEVNRHKHYIETEASRRRDEFREEEAKEITTIEETEEPYEEPETRYRSRQIVQQIPYTEQEPREREVTNYRMENYTELIPIQVPETYSYEERCGGLGGLFGAKKWVTGTRMVVKQHEVTKQRPVPYQAKETYYVTVNKVRAVTNTVQEPYQQMVTKYRKIMRPVTQTVFVEKPKPAIEYFINQVKEEEKAKIMAKYGH